ncbi:hypothetical protein CO037_01500 [Candidatus Pacearchaeota archaeon CG_4_9_14_0_2_um_filter_30_8]|nr:MAG: hypothetical protein CO037_01500 [Candidatus Pacearchaeota archaeon CG_4_9_14_0_2_um_filter_30_8]
MFVAKEKEELVAFATCNNYYGYWFLRNCVVHKDYRGKGIQKKLTKSRLDFLKDLNAKEVQVCVDPKNVYSLENILKSGFEIKGKKFIEGKEHLKLKKKL